MCKEPAFDYLEIRIGPGNWFSATALGWLVQIILSEVLGVPSTVESASYGTSRDFYDPDQRLDYDNNGGTDMLTTAYRLPGSDCRSVDKSEKGYTPCAHFVPEAWGNSERETLTGEIEPAQGNGILGWETWFMTKFTAVEYPQFVSYHGMVRPENRELLADLFKRPTTFGDYCEQVSMDNCTTPDDVAKRAPRDEVEANRMFLKDVYTGHFRHTEKNNCTLSDNCTGHIANYPCGWSTNMETNTYHLGIPLDPNNGENGTPGGYSQEQLMEMWDAANATRSHLIMMWWFPEPLVQRFAGSDAEFQRVVLPPYTYECAQAIEDRAEFADECSANITQRVGYPEEACEWPTEPLRKMITGNLQDVLDAQLEASRSPAYDMLRLFQISELQLGQLFDLYESEPTPRDAVCTWLANNFEFVHASIPSTYPRITREESSSSLTHGAFSVGISSAMFVLVTAALVYHNRTKAAVRFAQLDFLYILLGGSFLVSIGSILTSLSASNATCVAGIWFVHLGFTFGLVPLIIKAAALNSMMVSAQRMRRVTLSRHRLHGAVVFIGLGIATYLAVWTAVDPPREVAEYALSSEASGIEDDMMHSRVVHKVYYCSGGESNAWAFSGLGWNTFLLLCASVLAFQTRNIKHDFNESRTLAFLIYSHSVFVVLRICTYLLSEHFEGSTLRQMRGILYAVDQVAVCIIYFLPKVFSREDNQVSIAFGWGASSSPAFDAGSAGMPKESRGSGGSDPLFNAKEGPADNPDCEASTPTPAAEVSSS